MPEKYPRGEKASTGEVARAVQTAHELARTSKEHVEQYARVGLEPKSPILAWLLEHAAALHYVYQKGKDGMTPYPRVEGKEWIITMPAFAESVDFKKRTRHTLEARWGRGVFLGINVDTTGNMVGTSKGVLIVQAIRRLPENERYDSDAITKIEGLP